MHFIFTHDNSPTLPLSQATLPISRTFLNNWQAVLDFLIENPILGYLILAVVLSVVAFLMYGWDKRQAKTDGWRVPKKRLHAVAFLGGWPGAILGQNYFRHKTQKIEFKILTWLAGGLHVTLIGWYLYSRFTP